MDLKITDEESGGLGDSSPSSLLNTFPSSSSRTTSIRRERDPLSIVSSIRSSQSLVLSVDPDEEQQRRLLSCRSIFSSIFLFLGGLLLAILGGVYYWNYSLEGAMALFVVGILMLLPGSYGMTLLVGYCRGWPGYEADRLPLFD